MSIVRAVQAVEAYVVYDGTNSAEILSNVGTQVTGFVIDSDDETDGVLTIEWHSMGDSGTAVANDGDAVLVYVNPTVVSAADWAERYIVKE